MGDGVRLARPAVPAVSPTDELRRYPADPFAEPLDQRAVTLRTGPGPAEGAAVPGPPDAGWPGRAFAALDRAFTGLVGVDRLTLPAAPAAVLPAVVLGAGHAVMPGHGKTVMAAYLAGRRGRRRDALTVGLTVTFTHTAGVLLAGLALTLFSGLAGETLIAWLGAASGLLIAAIGAALLRPALRARSPACRPSPRSRRPSR
ncbi:hypothetical protein [Bailinhaonella thermotolerans]|uniref:Nickel/cobalt efflux system n=1 Tax=Bailinhaonella thermotolerans TaxID=1070861 RepID=A0A3A4AYB8_9ACTN|nr:hypothetical protein [Bailinhaonella thermotolerans]RJL33389.1 hypothetical protein D5H75_11400 [Bailinhaonella thermotolerans]